MLESFGLREFEREKLLSIKKSFDTKLRTQEFDQKQELYS